MTGASTPGISVSTIKASLVAPPDFGEITCTAAGLNCID
jgi:hypothetical protein